MKQIRRNLVILSVIGLLAFGSGIGYAAETSKVSGLQYGSPDTFAEFHGFINLEYFDFQKDGQSDEVGGPGTSTFDLHNFYFNSLAKIRQNLTVLSEVEYEHGGSGEITLDRGFLDWNLAADYLSLRLGKFYSPFGLEIRDYQAPIRKLISRPLMTDALLFTEWTEVGVNAYGRIKPDPVGLTYEVAVVNGPGDKDKNGNPIDFLTQGEAARQDRDNNSSRDVIARVSVPFQLDESLIEIGGSYSGGRYSATDAPEKLNFSLMGGDLQVQAAGLVLRGEYVKRKADVPGPVTGKVKVDSKSYYVQGSYRLNFNEEGLNYLEPVIRYDYLDPDTDTKKKKDETTQIALGIGYSPYPHFVMRAEYQINNRKNDPTTAVDESKYHLNGYLLQAVVDF
ncbi:MAG: hypothetical protein HY204_05295 [Nitrospirae bacterium]|nr:hypothetical protein [Nitrospirota bacterium]